MGRCCKRAAASRGFTLVELMVVIAIIGLLMAMLLPAVQLARESGRRGACINNLRQIGLAIHMYHDVNGAFPPGGISPGPCCSVESYTSWTIQILPFIEQKDLYNQYDQNETNESVANKAVRETFIGVYSCPSDIYRDVLAVPASGPAHDKSASSSRKVMYMPGSYRGVGGKIDGTFDNPYRPSWDNNPFHKQLPRRWRGVFHVVDGNLRPETFAAVSDGLSNTLMVGEYSTRPSKAITAANGVSMRTFWAYTYGSYNRSDAMPESRTLLGDYDRCTLLGGQLAFWPCDRAWGSLHTDTVNFLLCDGSVQSFPLVIDTKIFADAATIAGREFAPLP
jgi:prepilin-type N-terminal cleavage/methylation domain-containing protein/prepilin-type processing-associated H-X9-DG protein